ncbi:MAG: hypothetical protein ACOCXY_00820 [Planctomycetota bacterium]
MKKLACMTLALSAALIAVGCDDGETTVEGENKTALTFYDPADVTITRGETAELTLKIKRTKLDDEIAVDFTELPPGVSVVNEDKNIVGNEGVYRLQASMDADLVSNHQAAVSIKAAEKGVGVTKKFRITVEASE